MRADLLWRMPFPDLEHYFYFNIDAQNEYRPGYPIGQRIDYQASMILVNEPRNGKRSEDYYASLEPVYGAWILAFPPKDLRLTMARCTKAEIHHALTGMDTLEPDLERRLHPYRICLNGTSEVDWKRIAIDDPVRPFGILGDPFLSSGETAEFMRKDYGIILSDYTKEVKLAMNDWKQVAKDIKDISKDLLYVPVVIPLISLITLGAALLAPFLLYERKLERKKVRAEIFAELRSKGVDEAIIRDLERKPIQAFEDDTFLGEESPAIDDVGHALDGRERWRSEERDDIIAELRSKGVDEAIIRDLRDRWKSEERDKFITELRSKGFDEATIRNLERKLEK